MTPTPAHCLRAGLLILGTGLAMSMVDSPGTSLPGAHLAAAAAFTSLVAFGEWIIRRRAVGVEAEDAARQRCQPGSAGRQ